MIPCIKDCGPIQIESESNPSRLNRSSIISITGLSFATPIKLIESMDSCICTSSSRLCASLALGRVEGCESTSIG